MTTTPDDLAARLAALDSTVVSDALDGLGLPPGVGELIARWGSPAISGRVRTIELEPDRGGAPGPHIATSVIASARPGEVLVVANGGRTDVSCWGGILSLGSVQNGVVGVIADGACRDVAEAEQHGLPVFARAVSPRTARGRLRQRSAGHPVNIAGVPVAEPSTSSAYRARCTASARCAPGNAPAGRPSRCATSRSTTSTAPSATSSTTYLPAASP
jgi:regulator of RNase E activity RraA